MQHGAEGGPLAAMNISADLHQQPLRQTVPLPPTARLPLPSAAAPLHQEGGQGEDDPSCRIAAVRAGKSARLCVFISVMTGQDAFQDGVCRETHASEA